MITKANLQAYKDKLLQQLDLVDGLLDNFDRIAGVADDAFESARVTGAALRAVPDISQPMLEFGGANRQRRVRGVLAAVREIVQDLSGPFDKNQVRAKLTEKDPDLAASVSPANLRNTLRLLAKNGDITVQTDATSTTCAKYVSKRTAA
jgi:hypothetical protein